MSNNRLKPLMIACKNNDHDQVKLLLEKKVWIKNWLLRFLFNSVEIGASKKTN